MARRTARPKPTREMDLPALGGLQDSPDRYHA